MAQWVGIQSQVKVAKKNQKHPHLQRSLQRTPNQKRKPFFSISSRRLAESEVGLDSSLAQSGGKLQRCKLVPKFWRTPDVKGLTYRAPFHSMLGTIFKLIGCHLWQVGRHFIAKKCRRKNMKFRMTRH